MLLTNTARRLSIDIDIICPPGTTIENYINQFSEEYGFGRVELVNRLRRMDIPKQHAKFYYEVSYQGNGGEDKILLDVLYEEVHYSKIESLPIQSPLLVIDEPTMYVKVPSPEDLLGDKLTAFAPHTTGIPFYKGEKKCTMEIIKQMFDLASLFDIVDDLLITRETFRKFAMTELQYRHSQVGVKDVLEDIYQTALCICTRGYYNQEEYRLLQDGIRSIAGFIHSERYNIDLAIVNASKVAYIAKLLSRGENEIHHYTRSELENLSSQELSPELPTKLYKLRKTHPEAYFYWSNI